jgi:hypothetical protein
MAQTNNLAGPGTGGSREAGGTMKRVVLLAVLLTVALTMVRVQSAAATVPTLAGFAPASGPPGWWVTLTGTDFTQATEVSFTPSNPAYLPQDADFTVESDTTIVATVPFLDTAPLEAAIAVNTPDGVATSATDFSVGGQVTLSEHRGASGEPFTLTGSGFTGASRVVFGTWGQQTQSDEPFALANPVKAHFRVLSDTKIAVTVPPLRAGRNYWVAALSPAGTSVSDYSSPFLAVRLRLLRDTYSNEFAIRPAMVIPSVDGAFNMGQEGGHIHWRAWSAARAYGVGTVWFDIGVPKYLGTFHGYPGTITASRVRGGRFTRMTISWRINGRTHSQHMKLTKAGTDLWDW